MVAVRELLKCFGEASGLVCNFAKSSISSIRCNAGEIQDVIDEAGYAVRDLPITYLGLPLSIRNITRVELQPLLDRIAGQLPT